MKFIRELNHFSCDRPNHSSFFSTENSHVFCTVSYCVSHKGFGHVFDEISFGTFFKRKREMKLDKYLDHQATEFFQSLRWPPGEVFFPWLGRQFSLSQQQAENKHQGIHLIALRKEKLFGCLILSSNQEKSRVLDL